MKDISEGIAKAKRVVDKTKKSNIKCEHCKHWCKVGNGNKYVDRQCTNEDSPKNGTKTWYYNRCKCFDWAESENKDEV